MSKFLDKAGLQHYDEKIKAYVDSKSGGVNTNLTSHIGNKKNPHGVTKEQVGLGNVTNEAQIPLSQKGVASGVATLGTDGKLTAAQLPAMKTVNGVSVVGSGNISIDLSLYKVVDSLPTTGIDATKIYIVPAQTTGDKNIKVEYVYTGDPTNAYDASKWEKLGEAQTNIVVDTELNADSTNPIQNKAVKSAIDTLKQSITDVENKNIAQDLALTKKLDKTDYVVDADLSETSTNPLQNKTFYEYFTFLTTTLDEELDKKLNKSDYVVDSALNRQSKNPVQNKVLMDTFDQIYINLNSLINTAIGELTKANVGLNNVDNTADANKEVLSATKLKTARTLWGQSFDGTANVSGNITSIGSGAVARMNIESIPSNVDYIHIYLTEAHRPLVLQKDHGNVGIGVEAPTEKLEVDGSIKLTGSIKNVTEVYTTDGSKYVEPCTSDDIKALFA